MAITNSECLAFRAIAFILFSQALLVLDKQGPVKDSIGYASS